MELSYRDDDAASTYATPAGDGAADEAAWADAGDDFGPSEPAVIPPPDQQKPVRAAPVIRIPGQPAMQVPRGGTVVHPQNPAPARLRDRSRRAPRRPGGDG